MAGWRHDAIQEHQGHRRRRWLPRAGHHPLAGPGQARHGRERNLLRPRLVPHPGWLLPAIRTSPINCSRACSSATGPTRTISTATTRWIFSPAKAHPSATRCSTSAARPWARFASTTSSSRSMRSLMAGRAKRSRPTCPAWSTFARIRSSARRCIRGESLNTGACGYVQRLLRPRVLALRPGPAGRREAGADRDRVSADAGPGFVQPRGGEEEGRGDDQEPPGSVRNWSGGSVR